MFEASSVYFQCVNERAALVKIDCVSRWCRPGPLKSLISLVIGCLSTTGGSMNENQKALGV